MADEYVLYFVGDLRTPLFRAIESFNRSAEMSIAAAAEIAIKRIGQCLSGISTRVIVVVARDRGELPTPVFSGPRSAERFGIVRCSPNLNDFESLSNKLEHHSKMSDCVRIIEFSYAFLSRQA